MFNFEIAKDVLFLRCENFDSFSDKNGKNGRSSTAIFSIVVNVWYKYDKLESFTSLNSLVIFRSCLSLVKILIVRMTDSALVFLNVDESENKDNTFYSL